MELFEDFARGFFWLVSVPEFVIGASELGRLQKAEFTGNPPPGLTALLFRNPLDEERQSAYFDVGFDTRTGSVVHRHHAELGGFHRSKAAFDYEECLVAVGGILNADRIIVGLYYPFAVETLCLPDCVFVDFELASVIDSQIFAVAL